MALQLVAARHSSPAGRSVQRLLAELPSALRVALVLAQAPPAERDAPLTAHSAEWVLLARPVLPGELVSQVALAQHPTVVLPVVKPALPPQLQVSR